MKVLTAVALVVLAASVSACQPDAGPELSDSESTAVAAPEGDVDHGDCGQPALNASVRGATGTFATADEAARSVKVLPDEGSVVQMQAGEASAVFGWVQDGELLYVIDTHRGDDGWTVGSYVKCIVES